MKTFIYKSAIIITFMVLSDGAIDAQIDSSFSKYNIDDLSRLQDYLSELKSTRNFDINKVPINICFIKRQEKYVGFIIAGHASKDVCHVASLQVKNFLDSVGHHSHTVFSFGVGFDSCSFRNSQLYNLKLRELEKVFIDLQKQYYYEVNVTYVSDFVLNDLSNKIRDNTNLAFKTIESKDSINRVIFRYNDIKFPIPVPFYARNNIVTFTIPKTEVGKIPGAKVFDETIIDNALVEIRKATSINESALGRLKIYNPTYHSSFKPSPYYVTYSLGGHTYTDTLMQYDLSKVVIEFEVGTNIVTKNYSLSELKTRCANGEKFLPTKTKTLKNISPCEAARVAESNVAYFNQEKDRLIKVLTQTNRSLEMEKNKIIQFKSKFNKSKSSGDSIILIDAFLRGWSFKGANSVMNTQLSKWYSKRETVWKNVLAKNRDFKNSIEGKKVSVNASKNIAGIFHSADVFFSVKDLGKEYLVTPYKMLSGNFIQIIDKKNNISQFLSESNFRLVKL